MDGDFLRSRHTDIGIFILLFSMSQIDLMKFQALSDSFRDRQVLDFQPSIIPAENPGQNEEIKENEGSGQSDSLDELLMEIQSYLDKNGLEKVIVANRTERGLFSFCRNRFYLNPEMQV